MTRQRSDLDLFYIKSPCTADWNLLHGGKRIRYCGDCKKYVYNLSAMPRAQAEALIASSPQGNFCARITQRLDGTIVTEEQPPQLHQINRRPSPLAAAVVTAIMSLSPAIAAHQPLDSSATVYSAAAGQKKDVQPQDRTISIFGKITHAEKGSAVMGARVSLD